MSRRVYDGQIKGVRVEGGLEVALECTKTAIETGFRFYLSAFNLLNSVYGEAFMGVRRKA